MKVDVEAPFETDEGALVEPWKAQFDCAQSLPCLAARHHALFLDSARRHPLLGRYSFLTADPFSYFEAPATAADPLGELQRRVAPFRAQTIPGLPPFQGGAAGLLNYDLGRSLEKLPPPRIDEFQTPALAIGLYDVVLAIDHLDDRAWLISQGFPELEPRARRRRAAERLAEFRSWLSAGPPPRAAPINELALPAEDLAPQVAVPGPAGLTSNFSAQQYLAVVARAIEYIHAGDVFQVNIAQRLLYPAHDGGVQLYLRLRERNPATFAGYFDLGMTQIMSASPERFLKVMHGQVEARPIKGTRSRTARPEADLFAGDELLANEKDRAENVMIVDLLRNDLSRVC
ncbi:MAG TPA: chorismate-binding protein, partial [Pirellulales bacterium]|nr:chorismate-binding protein [Pirellulales bacterium]